MENFKVIALGLFSLVLISLFLNSCSKDEDENENITVPILTTKNASDITISSVQVGGAITSNGGASITERGICYSKLSNPTVADSLVQSGYGMGTFVCEISGLEQNTKYYFKAYAINSVGIGYGENKSFSTTGGSGGLPTVSTSGVTDITESTASCGGNVTDQGGSAVTSRGVCWSTSLNPTISDTHTDDGSGIGNFKSSMTGLQSNTLYYVRAYATNNYGTQYGGEVSFTTSSTGPGGLPCPGLPTFTDPRDGQIYPTVQIGDQCWFKKNLNYDYGTSACYNHNPNNCEVYGRLYDWSTIMNGASSSNAVPSGVQGICPPGWHVPSDAELQLLIDYLGGVSIAGGKLKEAGLEHWYSPNSGASNNSGFTALPAGRGEDPTSFELIWSFAGFFSSTKNGFSTAIALNLSYVREDAPTSSYLTSYYFSLRCLQD
jgi:uncharacterized protein (TIGR02145 family)